MRDDFDLDLVVVRLPDLDEFVVVTLAVDEVAGVLPPLLRPRCFDFCSEVDLILGD